MVTNHIIKIEYVRQGYLPNYPYHQISDQEMIEAFMVDTEERESFFTANYACVDEEFREAYELLKSSIKYHVVKYMEDGTPIPNWVYSYMLGVTISSTSPDLEKGDLLSLLNLVEEGDITKKVCESCLEVSTDWVKKLPPDRKDHRPPTMFGEPHVIKALRLNDVDISS